MNRLVWSTIAGFCFAMELLESNRQSAQGLKHTDIPCFRCEQSKWNRRRQAAQKKANR